MVDWVIGLPSWVIFYLYVAIISIDNTACVLMYVFIIGRNSDSNRLLMNGGLQLECVSFRKFNFLDRDVGGLGCRVKAVAGTLGST